MRTPSVVHQVLALVLIASILPSPAAAQKNVLYEMKEIPGGDLRYRTLSYLEYAGEFAPVVFLGPGFGLSGHTFRRRVGGEPGWGKLLKERGYTAWMLDNVGVGKAQRPPNADLDLIFRHGLFGNFQIGLANRSALVILHEQAAGMGLRARSFDDKYTDAMVLIDPIGPTRSQPMLDYDPARLLAEREDPNHLWRSMGFGPVRGAMHDGLDLTSAEADSLIEVYDPEQPPYWAALLTDYDANYEVREAIKLAGVPVLVVRTPAADAVQIEREEALVRWMNERGMIVETLNLADETDLAGTSAMPWAGELAPRVLDEIMAWYENLEGMRVPSGR